MRQGVGHSLYMRQGMGHSLYETRYGTFSV